MNSIVLQTVLEHFEIDNSKAEFIQISQGYINDTYLVIITGKPLYILQRINQDVFKNIDHLQSNIELALNSLTSEDYKYVKFYNTLQGKNYIVLNSEVWRLQSFIENSITYNYAPNDEIAFEAGLILGKFHVHLSNDDCDKYKTTIPNLNYLPFRLEEFSNCLKFSKPERMNKAQKEIEFAETKKSRFESFYNSNLPSRICHNDSKLNNILFDKTEHKGLCLIDLDTLMKGYFHYDFGDLVRTVVCESNEDETELVKIKFNKMFFRALLKGLQKSGIQLTEIEKKHLPIACALMPFMHGLRALTDYLNGNIYYKVLYDEQNLDRCKTLFRFTELAFQELDFMKKEIKKVFK